MALIAAASIGCGAPPSDDEPDPSAEVFVAQSSPACLPPPDGADSKASDAYAAMNTYRSAVNLPCSTFVPEIAAAAAAHCAYYRANRGACVSNPHREVSGCQKFRAELFGDRMRLAAYSGAPAYEAMTYFGSGATAVDAWVDSVWHRIPILSPYVQDAGYGGADACDTMDFGWAPTPATSAPVVYPYDGQIKVPTSFEGEYESPDLPVPPHGWPSGYPILLYASDLQIASHLLFDDKAVAVPHVWLGPDDPASLGILINEFAMYANAPLRNRTTYRVVLDGQRDRQPFHLEWSFTTTK